MQSVAIFEPNPLILESIKFCNRLHNSSDNIYPIG